MYKIYHIVSDSFVYVSKQGNIIHPALMFPQNFSYINNDIIYTEYSRYSSRKHEYSIYETHSEHKCFKIIKNLVDIKKNLATYGSIGLRIPQTFKEEYVIIKDNK